MERLHILSLQLDGHSRRFTFHILCTSFQEAPCVLQARFKKPLVFCKPGHAPSSTANIRIFTPGAMGFCGPVCMYVCVQECVYVAQRASERHREAQRGPERHREPIVHTYVCGEAQNVRAWIEQACHALGWLTGGLAGWLRPRELREALGLQLSGSYCVVLSSGNFNPQGKLGIQLSVMHCLVFC